MLTWDWQRDRYIQHSPAENLQTWGLLGQFTYKIKPLDKIVFWRKNTMQVWEQECSSRIKARLHMTSGLLLHYLFVFVFVFVCEWQVGIHLCVIAQQIHSVLRFICQCEQPPWFTASNVNEPRIPSSSPQNIKKIKTKDETEDRNNC